MIGVFDSGIGGFSVVKELFSHLPDAQIMYYGDVARGPYGNRSPDTIKAYSEQLSDFLIDGGCGVVVIACHTASAVAADWLRERLDVPVFDVVGCGSQDALRVSAHKRIGVMGTQATIASGRYLDGLSRFDSHVSVFQYACPSLATLIEDGVVDESVVRAALESYLSSVKKDGIDTLILGCTHYPLIREMIADIVGDEVTLVDPAHSLSVSLASYLDTGESVVVKGSDHRVFTSDNPEMFTSLIERFLGHSIECSQHVLDA